MDIVSLLGPQARARRNALRSLQAMRTRREQTEEAARAMSAAALVLPARGRSSTEREAGFVPGPGR